MRLAGLLLVSTLGAAAQDLPGTAPWGYEGDPAAGMVAGMARFLDRLQAEAPAHRRPTPDKLRFVLGVVDSRPTFQTLEYVADTRSPALRAETASWRAWAVRWPALDGVTAEGLWFEPKTAAPRRRVVAVPDADLPPEAFQRAQELATAGCEVLVPVLIDNGRAFAGNPRIRTNVMPHREWIYRMAFPVGRHPYGYEVQKVLAAVDWFTSRQPSVPVAVCGRGEGGRIARFAALLDSRINAVETEDASIEEPPARSQPLARNVFGLLRDFGDREIDGLLGARLQRLPHVSAPVVAIQAANDAERMKRQVTELVEFTQRLVRDSRRVRDELWAGVPGATPEDWRTHAEPLARRFQQDVLGMLPGESTPLRPRSRKSYEGARWEGHEVMFDVRPDVFGYGVLLVPKGLRPDERRPLVVVQHGLEGRPKFLFQQGEGRSLAVYRNFGEQLADLGFVVYLPQNPYIGDFRFLVKMANPLGLTLYSFITAQYTRMLDWLVTLPFVDANRIGYYGLSYGGKTALRVPPFDPRYKVAVCAGDFNEWIGKLTTPDEPWSYLYTAEYELLEWDMAHVANHAELAMLMAPRAFMVERGHRDGVGIDEWVASEYARVRRFFDERGIGDRTAIAWFNGPHRVDGPAAIAFLRRYLGWETIPTPPPPMNRGMELK
jgi:dienelactone hydrolase